MSKTLGFIVLRHVNDAKTNLYWQLSYDCIRKFYPENHIMIVDDNSNQAYITSKELYKTTIIQGEYPGRGELLPFIYHLQNKLFDVAVILHDSVFINTYVDFSVDNYKIIWEFDHTHDQTYYEMNILSVFNDKNLSDFYLNKHLWIGCFGGMCVITHDYLKLINEKYNIHLLINHVTNRYLRCCFERVISVLLQFESRAPKSMLGDIHAYIPWGRPFEERDKYSHLPLLKVWTGR